MKSFDDAESRIRAAYQRRRTDPAARQRESWFDRGNLFLQQERERKILELVEREMAADLSQAKILEVGCGSGYFLREFIKWGAQPENVTGIDLLEESVAYARTRCPPTVRVETGSAAQLRFPGGHFDVVLQSTVFTSILDSGLRRQVAAEMLRVLRPGGLVLWYDFTVDNPFNPDVAAVKAREVRQLFPNCRIDLHRVTLAPPLLRKLAPLSWTACYLLSKVPFLCTHLLGAIRKQ
jgi:ubiquinone/menaquinone biosynthesis C-methylase UbiE